MLAAVHAGWRGTAARRARALQAMSALGALPERVVAFIGPGVHPARYQVDQDVYQALSRRSPPTSTGRSGAARRYRALARRSHGGQPPAAAAGRGHPGAHLRCGVTTADDDYFSDRAARPCGRFALMARLTGAPDVAAW